MGSSIAAHTLVSVGAADTGKAIMYWIQQTMIRDVPPLRQAILCLSLFFIKIKYNPCCRDRGNVRSKHISLEIFRF
jgi:hypothetical protein